MISRRLLGPVGGPIAFFLVAGLVFAGLGWVTVAALHVEESQRESARRADREKDLRIALWRLDARMLPALGVEDTRPFHEFKTYSTDDPITVYGPASAPLLAGELPEWMQLHFQLDPELNWDSPQVLNRGTRVALRRNWPELPLRNVTKLREDQLVALNANFPARQASEAFAARERSVPTTSPATQPLSINGGMFEDTIEIHGERKDPAPPDLENPPKPAPVNVPAPPAIKESGAEAQAQKSNALAVAPPMIRKSAERDVSEGTSAPAPAPKAAPEAKLAELESSSNADGKKRAIAQNRFDYDDRQTLLGKAFNDAARFKLQLPGSGLSAQNQQMQNKPSAAVASAGGSRAFGVAGPSDSKPSGEAAKSGKELGDTNGITLNLPGLEFKKVESDGLGFYRLLEEARTHERERKQMDNLHRGGLKKEADRVADAAKDLKDTDKKLALAKGDVPAPAIAAPASLPAPGAVPPAQPGFGGPASPKMPAAPAGPPSAGAAPPGGGGAGVAGGAGLGANPRPTAVPVPVLPTPDPAPAAVLEPVDPPAPMFLPPAADEAVGPPPVAVHLGSLRPHWLTAPDGTPLLVLVRTARVENRKTVYQGVVLDWAKLQALLQDEVKDLFPEAKLEPVKESTTTSREQSMTALPVHLNPGPDSDLPPAGWSPLRIGLVLAWVAAAIAFTAVGLTGWSLLDLAERRIRFVSAVTHELRTPLTSLRLYLDLLLSGMVQDEDKRREYLSTLNVESDRLHRLIDNVLDFAKLERSRKGRNRVAVNAADLVDSIRLTWTDRVAADAKELVVVSTLPPELDIHTDAALVQQIVGNLIDNARKYTREATDCHIWLHARIESGTKVVFEVEDRGCGVPPGEQKLIFRPFRRGETADTKAGGAGLGLALSKEWAEVLGGKLMYRTPDGGVGSCFRLELPVKT